MNQNPHPRTGTTSVRSSRAAVVVAAAFALSAGCAGVAAPEAVETPTPSPTPMVPVADPTYAVIAPDRPTEESLAALGFAVSVPAEAEVVAGPGFATELRGVMVADELTPEQRDALYLSTHIPEGWRFSEVQHEPLLSGPGREFLLAWLDEPEDGPIYSTGDFHLTVDVEGEQSRPVEDAIVPWGIVALSVPVGAPVSLHIHHDGEVRSIDLRTGENRSESALATDGLHRGSKVVTDFFRVEGITTPDLAEGARLNVRIEPVHGAAEDVEPDRMKLRAELTVMFNAGMDWNISEHAAVAVDLASSVTIVADNGDRIPIPEETLTAATPGFYTAPTVEGSTSVTFDVPDTVRSFDVTFHLDATFTALDDERILPYQRHDDPQSTGTVTLESAG